MIARLLAFAAILYVLGFALFAVTLGEPAPADPASNSTTATVTRQQGANANSNGGGIGVVSSHGGGAAPAATAAGGDSERSLVNTAELDKRIKDAAAKAKAPGATEAEKKAAADAYVARGNVYYDAGQPRLYKYALADFKQALRYQPDNGEAKEKMDMIVSIYQSLGRPVPEVPAEQ